MRLQRRLRFRYGEQRGERCYLEWGNARDVRRGNLRGIEFRHDRGPRLCVQRRLCCKHGF